MRKTGFALLTGVFILSIAAVGWAAESMEEAPYWQTATKVEEKATVEAVDQLTRMVTLKDSQGRSHTFKVSDEVKNLMRVNVGDVVKFKYYESLSVRVLKSGEAFPKAGEKAVTSRAKKGEMPGGVTGAETTVNATIMAIDKAAKTANLKLGDGKTVTVTPRDPKNLEKVKVGDRLVITKLEAVAVFVEEAEKKK